MSVCGVPTAGSPYAAKVYDVQAIKVKESSTGVVGKAVTFLGKMFFICLLRLEEIVALHVSSMVFSIERTTIKFTLDFFA